VDSVVFEGLIVWTIINRGLLLQTIQMPSKSKPKKGKNKRTLSNSSPDNTVTLPVKTPKNCEKSPLTDQSVPRPVSMATQGYVQPMNMSNMVNMGSYQTPVGTFITSPQTQISNQPQFMSPQLSTMTASPVQQTQSQLSTDNFQLYVVEKLNAMDSRLSKLDSIETKISEVSRQIGKIDTRVTSLESVSRETSNRLTEVETSRATESQLFDDITLKHTTLEKSLKGERERVNQLKTECDRLKAINDDVIDLQARSMRDNLLFFGFAEPQTPDDRRSENCAESILNYCEKELNIPNASSNIKLERAHRIGRYEHAKIRPIVVKFNHYPDKVSVKQKCLESQKANGENQRPQIRVSEQYPKVIQDKRKQLIPYLVKAKRDGKMAHLSYDKLYINNKMYTVQSVAQSGYTVD